MIKVHCFVSCVCEAIKRTPGVDHRPFYFGVWDADFSISEQQVLSYHSEHTQHEFFKDWYQLLYGVDIRAWYSEHKSKEDNIQTLVSMLENRPSGRNVMVMLDMYHLPERENKFNQNPFPHYVMLETTDDPDTWFMYDPDFRWEGPLPKERILNAINQPSVAGGFYFDEVQVRHTSEDTVRAYFAQCMKHDCNPFTDAIRHIVQAHLDQPQLPLAHLDTALREIPVMAIRKYAFEHAFAYFWEQLDLDWQEFEHWTDEVEVLVNRFTQIQYRCMKLALTGNAAFAGDVFALLEQQDQLEFSIKQKLQHVFEQWDQQTQRYPLTANL